MIECERRSRGELQKRRTQSVLEAEKFLQVEEYGRDLVLGLLKRDVVNPDESGRHDLSGGPVLNNKSDD